MDRTRTLPLMAIFFAIISVFASVYFEQLINILPKSTLQGILSRQGQPVKAAVHEFQNNVTYIGKSHSGVEQFQNIFYGQDTSGMNRFAAPVPYKPVPGSVVDAAEPGAWCPQALGDVLPFTSQVTNISENCLSLRIARPAGTKPDAKLPVMVWLHSGGNVLGSASEKLYKPDGLIRQAVTDDQPVIYVAMNYRLGIFGFAMSDALVKAEQTNVGFRDQQLAFEWVKNNIAVFGGDPRRVTAFGHSVGGVNIGFHLIAYGGKRGAPFQNAIMLSGSPGTMINMGSEISKNATAVVAEKVGCVENGDSQSTATLACMREAPFEAIRQTSVQISQEARPPFGEMCFHTVIDNELFTDRPSKLMRGGQFVKGVSLLASWTANEGAWYASPATTRDEEILDGLRVWLPRLSPATGDQLLELYPLADFEYMIRPDYDGPISPQYYRAAQMSRDILFTCPTLDFTWHYVNKGGARSGNVRLFEHNATRYTPIFEKMGVPMWRVAHLSDIPYVFNELVDGGADNSFPQLELGKLMSGTAVKFASSSTPVGSSNHVDYWPLAYQNAGGDDKQEFSEQISLKVFGGQYGARTVRVSKDSPAVSAEEQAVLNEKLFERCKFINSDQFRQEVGI